MERVVREEKEERGKDMRGKTEGGRGRREREAEGGSMGEERGREREGGEKREVDKRWVAHSLHITFFCSFQLKGYGVSVIEGVDPNADNFVSAGIINTRSTLIGCLLRLEPNKETKVSHTHNCADNNKNA